VTIQLGDSETLLDTSEISFTACTGSIIFERVVIKPGTNPNLHDILPIVVVANQRFALGSTAADGVLRIPDGRNATFETPSTPAQKTAEDVNAEIAQLAEETERMLKTSTNEDKARWYEEELKETLDDPPAMLSKVREIASAIRAARHVVVYTGAGISTSADLPDYRGPNGLWTNKNAPRKKITLSGAHPTFAHVRISLIELSPFQDIPWMLLMHVDGALLSDIACFPIPLSNSTHSLTWSARALCISSPRPTWMACTVEAVYPGASSRSFTEIVTLSTADAAAGSISEFLTF
jgi:ElaB/YqjD/DUF883 family membrane-anchored ribosome-binding protein